MKGAGIAERSVAFDWILEIFVNGTRYGLKQRGNVFLLFLINI